MQRRWKKTHTKIDPFYFYYCCLCYVLSSFRHCSRALSLLFSILWISNFFVHCYFLWRLCFCCEPLRFFIHRNSSEWILCRSGNMASKYEKRWTLNWYKAGDSFRRTISLLTQNWYILSVLYCAAWKSVKRCKKKTNIIFAFVKK